jgi:hydroxyacylglutathione hydrolase
MPIEILPIKVFKDNYAYLLIDNANKHAGVVDPGSAGPIIDALNTRNLSLSHILLTHHHFDHSGGAKELKQLYPQAEIAIHKEDAHHLPIACDLQLSENDTLHFGTHPITVMHLPCHTRGHVALQIKNALFTGDTLFNAGCGKFFEGTTAEMLNNLQRLKTLPETTEIYCGHEYTVENLESALKAAPDNQNVSNRLKTSRIAADKNNFLVPTTLKLELNTNPFLQLNNKDLQQKLKTSNETDTLIALYQIYYGETPDS